MLDAVKKKELLFSLNIKESEDLEQELMACLLRRCWEAAGAGFRMGAFEL